MELSNILGALTGNDAIGAISQNLKIDQNQVSSVISNALPSLLGAMQKNASTPGGAEALACLAIAVLEIGTALIIEIRCRSLVEIACHDRQPVVIVEVGFKDFPFVLVGDNGFAEFA